MDERHGNYVSTYRNQSEDELDRLVEELDELEGNAQTALISEVKTRGRTDAEISSLIARGRHRKLALGSIEGADAVLTDWVGNVRRIKGTGRAFLGQANCEHNDIYGYDELDTTLWWTIVWIPFLPRGSFRIRRREANLGVPRFARGNSQFAIVRRLPFLWVNNTGWLLLAGILLWYPLVAALVAALLGHH
jgi:hypothetical protein